MLLSTFEASVSIKKVLVIVAFEVLLFHHVMTSLLVHLQMNAERNMGSVCFTGTSCSFISWYLFFFIIFDDL